MCKWWRLVYCCTPHIVPTFTRSMKWRAKPDKMTLNTGTNTEAKYNVNHYSTQHAVATPWLVPQKFCVALTPRQFVFTARSNYTSAILEIVILSVRLSVCLSVTRVLCDETKEYTADILIPHERVISLVFWNQRRLMGDVPFHLKFALKLTHPLCADFNQHLLITSEQ